MRRAVNLLIALAAIVALVVGAVVLLPHISFGRLLSAPRPPKSHRVHRQPPPRPARATRVPRRMRRPTAAPADSLMQNAPAYLGLAGWVGLLAIGVATATTVDRRLRNRLIRGYERYEIKLSMHDDAKPGDLEDMVEAIGAAVRKRYNDRVTDGQPFLALELWHRPSEVGMQWTLCLVCESHMARTLEGIIAGTYPDVRVGREFEQAPQPIAASVGEPRYVMRFRKRRPFIHPLGHPAPAATQRQGKTTPLTEAIAMTQTALQVPSLVRFQIMPASEQLEDRARRRLERHERQRHEHHLRERRGASILEQAEMRSAVEVRHRSMFYLEAQVGSSDWETCNRIAASLVARRGENHLHRRYIVIRQRLYRSRFPGAYPPLLPPLSLRNLVSGAELAHLLELPSARMKGVPVRRLTIPRMPAPPDAFCASDPHAPAAPLLADGALMETSG
jgi:DNA-binding XRE family transcriptional regulator